MTKIIFKPSTISSVYLKLEPFVGNVATVGEPITITPASGNIIKTIFIECNSTIDPDNPNNTNDALKYSIDGGTVYFTLMAGLNILLPGTFANLKLDTNVDGTSYQVIVWS